jgi:hypothetical protein
VTRRRRLQIGFAVMVALLLAAIIPNFRSSALSLTRPDPVGPTTYSKSALGHIALVRLLRELDIPVMVSESGAGGHIEPDDVLVIAEPRTDTNTLAEVRAMEATRTVLLVLPKRTGRVDRSKPYWISDEQFVALDDANHALATMADGTVARPDSLSGLKGVAEIQGSPTLERPQVIQSSHLHPLLAAPEGILIGERQAGGRRLVVLSDPDLIANHGLARGENSVMAVSLIEMLRGRRGGAVVFDEFVHGYSPHPFQILAVLFQFPFVLVTLQMGVVVLLLAWTAGGRFGAPEPLAPAIDAGKLSLIDTGARLLLQSGRGAELGQRYYEEMVRDAGRRLRAPRGLDVAALAAWLSQAPGAGAPAAPLDPRQVWSWRKELLGESRRHTKLD